MRNIYFLLMIISLNTFSQKKKVLLIGIDGLQFQQISNSKTPNFDKFTIKKAFTGGIFGTHSEQVTSSGPSWMTILTGVWTDNHKITSNSSKQICNFPSVFNHIRTEKKDSYLVSISTWKNINLLLYKDMYNVNFSTQGGTDEESTNLALYQIIEKSPDFTFVHLDEIDGAGHSKGFGKDYLNAIEKVDKSIGKFLKATKSREEKYNEDWLIILVTDHGRDEGGFSHGNQTIQEKTIFIGMNKKGNFIFNNINNNKVIKTIKELEKNAIPQTAVVPTILKFLDIPINVDWNLKTKSLIE